ncbi:hypothetical protein BJX68DRAFT_131992 [Aspergillus pseudodeflectus]|uniref:HTH La-type RNA-binding domain-containing protein n=1 Tax=Aspergillus pseudodeflectus TaxID=176178 RepID=A0ABR4K3N6_9EURO
MAATFSYAQAAKGIASTQPSKTPSESTTPVSKSDEQASIDSLQTSTDATAPKTEEVDIVAVNGENDATPADSKADISGPPSPKASTAQTSTTSKDDEASAAPSGNSESTWDKQSQASGSDKQNATEGNKKKSEKEKPAPPKELKAAPLPAVNIWDKRKEAFNATAVSKPVAAKAGIPKSTSENSPASAEAQEQSKAASKKKGGDASDRKKGDGAKGREDGAPVPPVADTTLWPTPQGAQGEEKKKVQDQSDKTEKSPTIRPHGKEKWVQMAYVPTAVFNTPLPSAARRGGRSARGGRDTTRNGASEKSSPGQASAPKHTASGERGRNEPNSARANSLPAPSRRSNSADTAPTDARKAPVTDRTRGPKGVDGSAAKHINGEAFPRNAKPFPRNHDGSHKGGEKNPQLSVDTHNGTRPNTRFENGPKTADFPGLHSDRKDKEFSREPRTERGRGGHRGRGGGHAGYNGAQTSHFPNNHMAPQSYIHPKFGYNDRRGSHLTNGSRGHPMTMRSPSLPNSNTMYNMYPYPPEINTMYGYPTMQTGPMSAVPFQSYEYPIVNMLSMQLEYYFSVDNLCKDIYLRKHMDSQGFVALNVIASFKRIKSLTEDFEMLRHVARQSRAAEYFVGEDGIDRLRPKDTWEQWVLPVDQREPSTQQVGSEVATQILDGATNGFVPKSLTNGALPAKTALSSAAPEFSPSNGVHTGSEVSN